MVDRFLNWPGRATGSRVFVSLVLAFMLWGWVTAVQDPQMTKTFANLEITTEPLPGAFRLVTALPRATVRVSGPRSVVADLDPADLNPRLATEGIDEPGTYTLPLIVDLPNAVRVRRLEPDEVPVEVEQTVARQFEIEVQKPNLTDDPRRIGDVLPSASEVTVSGAASRVARVERVVLPLDIGEHAQNFTAAFTPIAQDEAGNPIREVEIRPDIVSAFVPISARGKSVAVLPQVVGSPAPGFEVIDRIVNPATVLLDGPSEVLDRVVAVSTDPVDISGATETISERAGLRGLPDGVKVIQPKRGEVDVVVQVGQQGMVQPLPGQAIELIGLAEGLVAEADPVALEVVVVASAERLADLEAGDIRAWVDLEDLGPGTYRLPPDISVPHGMEWLRSEPSAISVTIKAPATPGATPGSGDPARPLP